MPLQAKKGRCKVDTQMLTSPRLFPNGKTHSFASAIVIWEACNALTQRQSLSWHPDPAGNPCYQRQIGGGRGEMTLWIAEPRAGGTEPQPGAIAAWDIRAVCLHLIFAAYATTLESPWEQTFTLNDQEISDYLGLDKRKDLNKLTKLTLIKDLVEQPCKLLVALDWAPQGKFKKIEIPKSPLWSLIDTQPHFQEDDLGCKHLTGLTFTLKAGPWAAAFLNRQGSRSGSAFYQYGTLPKSLLTQVMSIWQQHEGCVRMMLWLLFKTRMGSDQRITVPTLMRIAYGEEKLLQAAADREERKRLVRLFESDLEVLNRFDLKPVFDPITYPPDIQPLWVKLADLPDDAEAALEFWTHDGSQSTRLTDAAPRDKWHRLLHARLLCFDLQGDWAHKTPKLTKKKPRERKQNQPKLPLSGSQIAAARKNLNLSQRALADQLGKSQSWVRDIENGRLQVNDKDRVALSRLLTLPASQSMS